MEENREQVIDIEELVQDDKNFNSGTEEGRRLMEKSFGELGAGRSVLLDKNNRIIAGNKSTDAAIATGIKKVRVIETTGDELIAVKRTDIDLDSERGRKMALADNATQQANLSWDEQQLQAVADEIEGFDYSDWGVDFDFSASFQEGGGARATDGGIMEDCNNRGNDSTKGSLPPELQNIDLRPENLPKINGSDATPYKRIIIVYKECDEPYLREKLGIDLIKKVVFNIDELFDKSNDLES